MIDRLVRTRRFLDLRRRHLAAVLVAIMMAVVGIQLRGSGFADSEPKEYFALTLPEDPENPGQRQSLGTVVSNTLDSVQANIPSLSGNDMPIVVHEAEEHMPRVPVPQRPVITPVSRRHLIVPQPRVIDLAEMEDKPAAVERSVADSTGLVPPFLEPPTPNVMPPAAHVSLPEPEPKPPAKPEVAVLSGNIEFDDK